MKRQGRPNVKIALDASTRKELERLYETANCAKDRQKAQVLLLATEGIYSYQRLGEIILRSRTTVINWFNVFLSGGLDALLGDAERSGRPSELSGEISGAMAKGLEDGRWVTSGQVKEWLRDEHGITRAGSTVRYWLGKTRRGAQGASPRSRQEGRGSRRGLQSAPV